MALSSYEQERIERIKVNKSLMTALGLDKKPPVPTRSTARPRLAKTPKESEQPILPTRRSTRATKAPEHISLPDDWREPEISEPRPQRKARYQEADEESADAAGDSKNREDSEQTRPKRQPPKQAKPRCQDSPPDSSRNLVAEVALLSDILGKRVPGGHVKAAVMQFASPKVTPRFSKYVGVQEWLNAVFLMFNVVAGNQYGNTFVKTKTGMQVTYFLSERTSPDAPIVHRLQRVQGGNCALGEPAQLIELGTASTDPSMEEAAAGSKRKGRGRAASVVKEEPRESAEVKTEPTTAVGGNGKRKREEGEGGEEGSRDSVHLFCRPAPESFKKLGLPHADYVYLGSLGFVECDVDVIPIKFVFELLDYPTLSTAQDFQDLLALAKR